jgi:hypothetical protein
LKASLNKHCRRTGAKLPHFFSSKETLMCILKNFINLCEPDVDDVIGFMDGLSLTSECTSEPLAQNSMYNGYHSDAMVNNVVAYGPDGKVFLCAINLPGSWHDVSITANLLPYIHEKR